MFEKGQKIVYGQTGVCLVEDITEKELIRNQKKQYYVLKPLFQQNNIIYAPVDSDKVFMRPVISAAEAEELIKRIPEIKSRIKCGELLPENYREVLQTHENSSLIELAGAIYEKKKAALANKKKLGFSDEKYMKLAESLLFGELSVALDIPFERVQGYIEEKLK